MSALPADRAKNISNTLLGTGICFRSQGVLPWLVSPDKFPLTLNEQEQLTQLGHDCFVLLETVHEACVDSDTVGTRIVQTLGGNPVRAALTLNDAGMHPVPMVRPDVFWDVSGRLTVVEIETMIGGYGMTHAMRTAYGENGFRGNAASYAELVRELTHDDQPVVAVVNPESKQHYDHEFRVFAAALKSFGIEMIVSRPNEITIRNGQVYVAEQRVSVIHRFFRHSELVAEDPSALNVLKEITERRLVPLLQPWKEILEEKALFAFLHDPTMRGYWVDHLGTDTFQRLTIALPRSVLVDPDSEFCQTILKSSPATRPYWLKKSGETWGGRGATDGGETTNKKWLDAMQAAFADVTSGRGQWILQERRVCRPTPVSYLKGDEVTTKDMNLRVSPFFLRHGGTPVLSDVLVTARRSTKVHGAEDAVMFPAACV